MRIQKVASNPNKIERSTIEKYGYAKRRKGKSS